MNPEPDKTARARRPSARTEIWNLPNAITMGRLLLIPPVLWLLEAQTSSRALAAAVLFVVAALLDVVDGWLARRRDEVTFFGKFMDPLADKIMVAALLVYLVGHGRLAAWAAVVLVAREFYISGLRMLALNEGIEIPAGSGGKAKTLLQMCGVTALMLSYVWSAPVPGTRVDILVVGTTLIYASLVLSLWSAYDYTRGFVDELGRRGAA